MKCPAGGFPKHPHPHPSLGQDPWQGFANFDQSSPQSHLDSRGAFVRAGVCQSVERSSARSHTTSRTLCDATVWILTPLAFTPLMNAGVPGQLYEGGQVLSMPSPTSNVVGTPRHVSHMPILPAPVSPPTTQHSHSSHPILNQPQQQYRHQPPPQHQRQHQYQQASYPELQFSPQSATQGESCMYARALLHKVSATFNIATFPFNLTTVLSCQCAHQFCLSIGTNRPRTDLNLSLTPPNNRCIGTQQLSTAELVQTMGRLTEQVTVSNFVDVSSSCPHIPFIASHLKFIIQMLQGMMLPRVSSNPTSFRPSDMGPASADFGASNGGPGWHPAQHPPPIHEPMHHQQQQHSRYRTHFLQVLSLGSCVCRPNTLFHLPRRQISKHH